MPHAMSWIDLHMTPPDLYFVLLLHRQDINYMGLYAFSFTVEMVTYSGMHRADWAYFDLEVGAQNMCAVHLCSTSVRRTCIYVGHMHASCCRLCSKPHTHVCHSWHWFLLAGLSQPLRAPLPRGGACDVVNHPVADPGMTLASHS